MWFLGVVVCLLLLGLVGGFFVGGGGGGGGGGGVEACGIKVNGSVIVFLLAEDQGEVDRSRSRTVEKIGKTITANLQFKSSSCLQRDTFST